MLRRVCAIALLLLAVATLTAQEKKQPATPRVNPDSIYKLSPDSKPQMDVPHGELSSKQTFRSKLYDNTDRDYWVYLPAGLDRSKPVRLMVFQDGNNYANPNGPAKVTNVFDNLIYRKELPQIVGVFVMPGVPLDNDGKRITDRGKINAQRSIEYDTLSPKYAEFLEKELLPHVEKDYGIKFSKNPNDRAICGISSGGICAFTAAWERPDLFRKVLSHVGSFTNIRGGGAYPDKVQKTEKSPKPLRVFLQDGSNDIVNQFGSWPEANQKMAAALKAAHYDYCFEFGSGQHSLAHGSAIMPESLKWLWREDVKK